MPYQFSTRARNAAVDAIEGVIGTSGILQIRTGAVPANCAAADTGTALVTINLPANPLSDAVAGAKALLGSWVDASADASGDLTSNGHFRFYGAGGICDWQGTCGGPGSGRDMILDSAVITAGQQVTILSADLIAGGA